MREERTLVVDGVLETWQLVWVGKPGAACGPKTVEDANTCPCSGFAYGEYGNLWLVRKRHGREVERMDLKPLFNNDDVPAFDDKMSGQAFLSRWPETDNDLDRENKGDPGLVRDIEHRPQTPIMIFADYDHDGHATEFLVQVGPLPCGKHQFAAIGVTAANRYLHVLTTQEKPKAPLMMPGWAWQALLKAEKPTTVTVWSCDDHGSEVQSDLIVSAQNSQIHVRDRELSCPTGKSQKLISESDWDSVRD